MSLCIPPYRHLLGIVSRRSHQRSCFSTARICRTNDGSKEELLPDQRLQAIVAELEKSSSILQTKDVLLESIEAFRPKKEVISTENMDRLYKLFQKSFSVRQLADYSAVHKLPRHGRLKNQLIDGIVKKHWGIQSTKDVDAARQRKALEMRRDTVKEIFPATFQQLFFIIGNNGDTIRNIEENYHVFITIDVDKQEYAVEGLSKAVAKAKEEILTHLNILEDQVDVPEKIKRDPQLRNDVNESLVDMSKLAASFITLEDDKFSLASTSAENLSNAKRLLNLTLTEMNATGKKALSTADHTVIHKDLEFTVLPMQDVLSMPFYDKKLNWNKLEYKKKDEKDDYMVFGGQEMVGEIGNTQDLLVKSLNNGGDAISIEARFGKLLFQDNHHDISLSPGCATDLATLFKNRSLFLNSIPPRKITAPYIPIIRSLDGGFHQRTIQLDYVNQSLLAGKDENSDLKRLLVEFTTQENGSMNVKKIIAEKNRSVVDVLGMFGNVDVRLIAKQYLDYTNDTTHVGELIERCKLMSYSQLSAPKQQPFLNDNFVLADISFINTKRYLFDDGLISVNHIEQQDKKVKRTEMMVTSLDPLTWNTANATDRWPSFIAIVKEIARRWDYIN
ncbi:hypothetical protein BD408DRAFT_486337 [Parasitella parasitica]|nr:hypothetical protein BD408DRAFT_486337 [Parasitella parasitica]